MCDRSSPLRVVPYCRRRWCRRTLGAIPGLSKQLAVVAWGRDWPERFDARGGYAGALGWVPMLEAIGALLSRELAGTTAPPAAVRTRVRERILGDRPSVVVMSGLRSDASPHDWSLNCPRCGLTITPKVSGLAISQCPRCLARTRAMVELFGSRLPADVLYAEDSRPNGEAAPRLERRSGPR